MPAERICDGSAIGFVRRQLQKSSQEAKINMLWLKRFFTFHAVSCGARLLLHTRSREITLTRTGMPGKKKVISSKDTRLAWHAIGGGAAGEKISTGQRTEVKMLTGSPSSGAECSQCRITGMRKRWTAIAK